MTESSRRSFLQSVTTSVAAGSLAGAAVAGPAAPRLQVGFIGCGGRSQSLLAGFQNSADIRWACDPDRKRAETFAKQAECEHTTSDLRQVLDDPGVDAVVIATPDHWHAPAAILACQAGKHVYVEKPCSHNLRESRLLLDAARRNQVVVQHGTQSRSNPQIVNAVQLLREGLIGDVLMAKAWNVQQRRNIGHGQPSDPPVNVDYDLWVGPAEYVPFQQNRFHYDWHWWHNFGTGDIGNDGTHELDIARWGLQVSGLPSTVTALGGKYFFDDDQQFPDTATCAFEWPGDGSVGQRRQLVFEMRLWSRNYPHNCDNGVEFYGTRGMLFVSKRGKLQVWDEANRPVSNPVPRQPVRTPENHQVDFLQAIASGTKPLADIAEAHDSVALVHLANIAVRTGRTLQIDPHRESIVNDDQSQRLLTRTYRSDGHWAIPQDVDSP